MRYTERENEQAKERFRAVYESKAAEIPNDGGSFHRRMALVMFAIFEDQGIPRRIKDIGMSAVVAHIRHEVRQYNSGVYTAAECPFWNVFSDVHFTKRIEKGLPL